MKSYLFIILAAVNLLTGCAKQLYENHYIVLQNKNLDNAKTLIKLAGKKFGKLTESDKILFAAVADGNWAYYSEGEDKDNPDNSNRWGERRTINADRIEWLCREKKAKEFMTDKGIQITGAKIKGMVDLSFAEVPFPLIFLECDFNEMINMQLSKIKFL